MKVGVVAVEETQAVLMVVTSVVVMVVLVQLVMKLVSLDHLFIMLVEAVQQVTVLAAAALVPVIQRTEVVEVRRRQQMVAQELYGFSGLLLVEVRLRQALRRMGNGLFQLQLLRLMFFMVGGGGPGGKGGSSGGGGGGGVLRHTTFAVTPGIVWDITIGAGGVATGSTSTMGTNGGDTTFANSTYAATMDLRSNVFTAQTAPTTARIVLDEESYKGLTTLNTDIKAYASRDNGTTYTQVTLARQASLDYKTSLLLHCDGANDGVVFTDSSLSPHTITVVGSTHTDTAVKKFGTASAQFDGTGDSLTIPDSSAWDFNTDPFAIDLWVNCNSTQTSGSYKGIVSSGGSVWVSGEWTLTMNTSNGFLEWWRDAGAGGILMITSTTNFKDDAWHHVAVTKQGDDTKMFVDGTQEGSTYDTGYSLVAPSTGLEIGDNGFGVDRSLVGYIDELRITKGLSRWTANFTPPTAPYTAYEGDRQLLSGSVDISGQPSGTNMKYKLETLNQSATKETRVYGTSMAWA